MVRKDDAFTQRFRAAKGVRTRFFFRFGPIAAYGPPNQKKASPDPFHENMVRKVYMEKISGPYQLFYGSGPIFFCSVYGALACRRLLFLLLHRIFLSVSNSRILIFLENAGFLCEQKDNLKKYHC